MLLFSPWDTLAPLGVLTLDPLLELGLGGAGVGGERGCVMRLSSAVCDMAPTTESDSPGGG